MADFTYQVIDASGKEKKGNIKAEDENDAKRKLKNEGYMVISLTKATALTKEISFEIGGKISPRDLSVFSRQFVSMVNAGVTILDTLEMLGEQTENKTMAKAIKGVYGDIQKGETLSDGLRNYPKVFPKIMISMVAAGEASGKIDVAFERMANHFEKSAKMNGMLKKAAVYPIMVTIVALVVVVVMLVKVIPSYQDMFNDMGTELPKITQIVVEMSHFVTGYWFIILAIIIAAVIGIKAFSKTIPGQQLFGTISRKLPVFGNLVVKTASSNFARTLSTLIYSGLPMIEALAITANTMTNYWYKQALQEAKDEVSKGVPLSEPIIASGLFPPMVGHMTKIGEETGDLEGMLNRMSEYYDEEVEMATQTVMAAMEPMIIMVLAVVVGGIVAAIMAPMLSMYTSMDSL
ncbi:MAG: type II secretion system F family protein [Agathobacter sp.]|nr:type II secretion system F family protein [Agathobacter sp.]